MIPVLLITVFLWAYCNFLPRLQSRFHILVSAMILTLINSFWHLRIVDIGLLLKEDLQGFSDSFFPDMGLRLLISLPVIFVIVYLFNKTKGSLIIMILFQSSAYICSNSPKGKNGTRTTRKQTRMNAEFYPR